MNFNKTVLFITYIDFEEFYSGSQVRPQKMYEAFKNLGYEVKLLECQQNRFSERKKAVKDINKWLNNNKPDFCYIESPSGPIFNFADLKLIKRISKAGIKIGFYYRDLYWLFKSKQNNNSLKQLAIYVLNKLEIHYLKKYCYKLYLPTESAAKILKSKTKVQDIDLLPPACENKDLDTNRTESNSVKTCIYVGGVSNYYGSDILLEAFKIINIEKTICKLILVCRKKEFENFFGDNQELKQLDWLKVVHAEGAELSTFYRQSDFAVIPLPKGKYQDLALNIKFFEYLSYLLPVVSTNVYEVSKIIIQNDLGVITQDNEESLAKGIVRMSQNEEILNYKKNIKSYVIQNVWEKRAEKVAMDLIKG